MSYGKTQLWLWTPFILLVIYVLFRLCIYVYTYRITLPFTKACIRKKKDEGQWFSTKVVGGDGLIVWSSFLSTSSWSFPVFRPLPSCVLIIYHHVFGVFFPSLFVFYIMFLIPIPCGSRLAMLAYVLNINAYLH
jgi:hypothetical protein